MEVKLLHNTPLEISDLAISKCWNKNSGEQVNEERMHRVGNKFKHSSTLEHITYNFDIDGISRACLQELARHRMANLSVKSSRYTLKELKDAINIKSFIVQTNNEEVDRQNLFRLNVLQDLLLTESMSNDIAKYMLPEAYKTSLVWTINMRSLQNFLKLRTDKSALWEIRKLAYSIYNQLPESHRFMFTEFIYKESNED